jgi:hypothetical protein
MCVQTPVPYSGERFAVERRIFMAHISHASRHRHRRAGHSPLAGPVILFIAAMAIAVVYVAYVLWPRWPDVPVARDAPSLPIVIGGVAFNIEPAAIRMPVQRRPGTQERVELAYLWPSLMPPDPALKVIDGAPVDPNERLFLTIQVSDGTMPPVERLKAIYPRYLADKAVTGSDGLTLQAFRADSPYGNEELAYEQEAPAHFMARCARKGVINTGSCLLERRIDSADVTIRFPREWLNDWKSVSAGIDRLMARLHPSP